MLDSVEKALEYDKIRALLKKYTASQLGTARVDTLAPSRDVDKVRYLLTVCSETKFFHQIYGGIPLNGLKDIRTSLTHAAKVGALLDAQELLDIRKVAQIPEDIHRAFKKRDREEFPNLFTIVDALPVFPELIEAIRQCIDAEGMLLDRASPELRTIRRKLSRLRENIHQKLEAASPDAAFTRASESNSGTDHHLSKQSVCHSNKAGSPLIFSRRHSRAIHKRRNLFCRASGHRPDEQRTP